MFDDRKSFSIPVLIGAVVVFALIVVDLLYIFVFAPKDPTLSANPTMTSSKQPPVASSVVTPTVPALTPTGDETVTPQTGLTPTASAAASETPVTAPPTPPGGRRYTPALPVLPDVDVGSPFSMPPPIDVESDVPRNAQWFYYQKNGTLEETKSSIWTALSEQGWQLVREHSAMSIHQYGEFTRDDGVRLGVHVFTFGQDQTNQRIAVWSAVKSLW